MAINKGTIAKEINGVVEYVYPKTSADVVEYSPTQSVKNKLDSLGTNIQTNITNTTNLSTIIGDSTSGLVKDVNDLKNVIENFGLATDSEDGLMSSEDKTKLDGIESGANNIIIDSELDTSSTNPVQNKVITEALNNKANINHIHTTVNGHTVESNVPADAIFTDTTYTLATQSKDGLMSKTDKIKIDNIVSTIINDKKVSSSQTYSSKKINMDYYNKNQVDNIFSQVGWVGTLEAYNTMLGHISGMLYTTVDSKGNIRRFLGDIELKNDTIVIGKSFRVLTGISYCRIGMCEGVDN